MSLSMRTTYEYHELTLPFVFICEIADLAEQLEFLRSFLLELPQALASNSGQSVDNRHIAGEDISHEISSAEVLSRTEVMPYPVMKLQYSASR